MVQLCEPASYKHTCVGPLYSSIYLFFTCLKHPLNLFSGFSCYALSVAPLPIGPTRRDMRYAAAAIALLLVSADIADARGRTFTRSSRRASVRSAPRTRRPIVSRRPAVRSRTATRAVRRGRGRTVTRGRTVSTRGASRTSGIATRNRSSSDSRQSFRSFRSRSGFKRLSRPVFRRAAPDPEEKTPKEGALILTAGRRGPTRAGGPIRTNWTEAGSTMLAPRESFFRSLGGTGVSQGPRDTPPPASATGEASGNNSITERQ